MIDDPQDRFGVTDEAFQAARVSHGLSNPVIRWGMYVPTRQEVKDLDPADVELILDGWLWENPTELIPTHAQIEEVRRVLLSRHDAGSEVIQRIIEDCDEFLRPFEQEEG